jgi:hypothetical protein
MDRPWRAGVLQLPTTAIEWGVARWTNVGISYEEANP